MNIFSKKRNRVIAAVTAASIAVSVMVVALSTTLAAKPEKQIRLVQPNSYSVVKAGGNTTISVANAVKVDSSDKSIATVSVKDNKYLTINGIKAGTAGISYGNKTGGVLSEPVQVVNVDAITGYDLPEGGNGYVNAPRGTALSESDLKVKYYKTNAPARSDTGVRTPSEKNLNQTESNYIQDASLASQVEWTSVNPEVVNENLVPVAKGVTVLIGKFTDRWGVAQTICYIFGVGVVPGLKDSDLNALLDAIEKAEKIIDEYNNGNPNNYDSEVIDELQDAVNKGLEDITNEEEGSYKPDTEDINYIIENIVKDKPAENTIPPSDKIPTGVSGRVLSADKAGDTSTWIEIAQNGGYSLILRSNCEKPNALFNTTLNSRYAGSVLETRMNTFYSNLPSVSGLKQYGVPSNAVSRIMTTSDAASLSNINAFSVPLVESTETTSGMAFALSYQEYALFCSLKNFSGTSPAAARSNFNLLKSIGDVDLTESMSRSPNGSGYLHFIQLTSIFYGLPAYDGFFHDDAANLDFAAGIWCHKDYGKGWGVRPAMWVDSAIFD